ncbi:MAG: hypothetical protein DRJ42_21110 [Deltaproteobacteria bacterium]|nr:MAG: hypothetical protein DRJ42_21110 [Deltaproteobacteria bacterium]
MTLSTKHALPSPRDPSGRAVERSGSGGCGCATSSSSPLPVVAPVLLFALCILLRRRRK